MRILKDDEIESLLKEPKNLPYNWHNQFQVKDKSNFQHQERSIEIKGTFNSSFIIILRKNKINIFDFSIILIFQDKDDKEYRLIRYNGKHPSEHTNKWEKEQGQNNCKFSPSFHIHKATQRYQEAGYPIDGYAEVSTTFHDFHSALNCFLKENNFKKPDDQQKELFRGGDFV
jgi:hypothetical protein